MADDVASLPPSPTGFQATPRIVRAFPVPSTNGKSPMGQDGEAREASEANGDRIRSQRSPPPPPPNTEGRRQSREGAPTCSRKVDATKCVPGLISDQHMRQALACPAHLGVEPSWESCRSWAFQRWRPLSLPALSDIFAALAASSRSALAERTSADDQIWWGRQDRDLGMDSSPSRTMLAAFEERFLALEIPPHVRSEALRFSAPRADAHQGSRP